MPTLPLLAAARAHYAAGRLADAEALYRDILAADPENAAALQWLAVLAQRRGDEEAALALFRRAIAADPDCAAADASLGRVLEQRGDLDGAATCYSRAVRLRPQDAAAHHGLGRVLHRQERLAEAVASYTAALQLAPNLAEAHSDLGEGLRRLGRIGSARAACRRAVALNPDLAEAHNNLGNVLQDQGQLAEAIRCYERALGLRPDLQETRRNLANALWEWRHSAAAMLAQQQAITRTSSAAAAGPASAMAMGLRERDWLLGVLDRHRQLLPAAAQIERRAGLSSEEFLERYYAANRPVILAGEMAQWPALSLWTPDYLRAVGGANVIEYEGGREANPQFARDREQHLREMAFDQFIDLITRVEGNDAYMTNRNWPRNAGALSALHKDLGSLDKYLSRETDSVDGGLFIGPRGAFTPLHYDLSNNFLAQVVGRKQLKLVSPSDLGLLYNHTGFLSDIPDLEEPGFRTRDPLLAGTRIHDVELAAGEIIFLPLGWWHQTRALEFSITISYRNFLWPNVYGEGHPCWRPPEQSYPHKRT